MKKKKKKTEKASDKDIRRGMESASPESLALASNSFPLFPLGSPKQFILSIYKTAAPTALTQGIQDNIIKNILFGH